MQIFGFTLPGTKQQNVDTIVAPSQDDGSVIVSNQAGHYASTIDLDGAIKTENDLLRRYRDTAGYPECDTAIDNIVNEAIIVEEKEDLVNIDLDLLEGVSPQFKKAIDEEFKAILRLLDFNYKAYDIFRSWYIDGRLYYHIILDPNNPQAGIVKLQQIDPRKIRKIKKVLKKRSPQGAEIITGTEEYFIYNDKGINDSQVVGTQLSTDSVSYVNSGNLDYSTGMIQSYLHKAIKPVNQLRMIEDAMVIYRLARSSERRVFYVDVGNLPKQKAEQYLQDMMAKFKNKIVYDAKTGEIRDDRKHMAITEDFWMPRREGGRGTEITTLAGGSTLSSIDDIVYFQKKLYKSLNVPIGRLDTQDGFNIGKSSEITREEVSFNKFVQRLRLKFSQLFLDCLKTQLIAKGIMSAQDWEQIEPLITFIYARDNYFAELKDNEILATKAQSLQMLDPFVGKYFSVEWVQKKVMKFTDDEIEEIQDQNQIAMEQQAEQQAELVKKYGINGDGEQSPQGQQ